MPAAPRPGQRHGPAPRWGQRVKRTELPARTGPGNSSRCACLLRNFFLVRTSDWMSVPQTGRQRQPVPRTGLGWEREEKLLGPYLGLDVTSKWRGLERHRTLLWDVSTLLWELQDHGLHQRLEHPGADQERERVEDDHVMTNLYSGWPSCLLLSSFFWPHGRSLRWPLLSTISSSLHSSRGSPCILRHLQVPL
jgi:hypothetical protein